MAHKQFPCGQCGAKLEFDPTAASLKCPYCEHETPIPQAAGEVRELDFSAAVARTLDDSETEEKEIVKCATCAAQITLDANITADKCPYCDSDIVKEGGTSKQIKPRSVLPFAITRKDARAKFHEWVKNRWFAPNKLKDYAGTENRLAGMYVPYWTYDAFTTTFYTGERGDDYTTTESYTTMEDGKSVTKTRQVTKTRWTSVSGTVWEPFDDILILASRSLPKKCADKLEPWDLRNLEPYSDEFLSGYRAESYQVDIKEGFNEAREVMDDHIGNSIEDDIGGDHQRIHGVDTQYDSVTFKHILLPMWISAYRYGETVYRFLVNARTGEVQGERPWSWVKITLAVLAGLAAIGTIIALAQ